MPKTKLVVRTDTNCMLYEMSLSNDDENDGVMSKLAHNSTIIMVDANHLYFFMKTNNKGANK